MSETASTRTVTPFEARLLTILRAIVRLGPLEPALPYLTEKADAPAGLTENCLSLACDSLAKGCINYLARQGGWRREPFLRDGKRVTGRVWERDAIADLKLHFTAHTFDFLLWLTTESSTKPRTWNPPEGNSSIADDLVTFLAYEGLREADAVRGLRGIAVFANSPICRLAFATDFIGHEINVPNFSNWMTGLGGAILEALQRPLTESWLRMEHDKRNIADWHTMNEYADAQDAVFESFHSTAEKAGRMDLARFLLRAAATYCTPERVTEDIIGGLLSNAPQRLAERYEIQRKAGVLPRVLNRLRTYERRARGIGYWDEGYEAAQSYLADWERVGGDSAFVAAERLARELEPMSVAAAGVPS